MDFISDIDALKRSFIESTELIKSESFENGKFISCGVCSIIIDFQFFPGFADEMTNKRLQLGERLILLKDNQKRIDNTLRQAHADSSTLEEFKEIFEELNEKEKKKRVNIKLTTEYKEFKKQILAVSNVADTDDVFIVNAVSLYDPWSKALMVNPVRNTNCGHYYDLESAEAAIKHNRKVRCPVAGCASKSYIELKNLEPDSALLEKTKNYRAQREAQIDSSSDDEQ